MKSVYLMCSARSLSIRCSLLFRKGGAARRPLQDSHSGATLRASEDRQLEPQEEKVRSNLRLSPYRWVVLAALMLVTMAIEVLIVSVPASFIMDTFAIPVGISVGAGRPAPHE